MLGPQQHGPANILGVTQHLLILLIRVSPTSSHALRDAKMRYAVLAKDIMNTKAVLCLFMDAGKTSSRAGAPSARAKAAAAPEATTTATAAVPKAGRRPAAAAAEPDVAAPPRRHPSSQLTSVLWSLALACEAPMLTAAACRHLFQACLSLRHGAGSGTGSGVQGMPAASFPHAAALLLHVAANAPAAQQQVRGRCHGYGAAFEPG